jgi:hypothetical protein
MDELANEIIYFGAAVAAIVGALHIVSRFEVWRPIAMVALSLLFYMDAITWHFGKQLESYMIPTPMRLLDTITGVAALGMVGLLHNVHATKRASLRGFLCCALVYISCVMLYWLLLCTKDSASYEALQKASAIAFGLADRDHATTEAVVLTPVSPASIRHSLWTYGWRVLVAFGFYLLVGLVSLVAACRKRSWLWANRQRPWKLTAFFSLMASILYLLIGVLLPRPMGMLQWLAAVASLSAIPLSALMICKFHETDMPTTHGAAPDPIPCKEGMKGSLESSGGLEASRRQAISPDVHQRVLELGGKLSVRGVAKRLGLSRLLVWQILHGAVGDSHDPRPEGRRAPAGRNRRSQRRRAG